MNEIKLSDSDYLNAIPSEEEWNKIKDKTVIVKCRKCSTELYRTDLTFSDLQGRLLHGEELKPIGNQPETIDNCYTPMCHKCDEPWCGVSDNGKVILSTSFGLIIFG